MTTKEVIEGLKSRLSDASNDVAFWWPQHNNPRNSYDWALGYQMALRDALNDIREVIE